MIMQCIDSEVKMVALEPRPSKIIVDVMDSIQAKFDFRGHNVRLDVHTLKHLSALEILSIIFILLLYYYYHVVKLCGQINQTSADSIFLFIVRCSSSKSSSNS